MILQNGCCYIKEILQFQKGSCFLGCELFAVTWFKYISYFPVFEKKNLHAYKIFTVGQKKNFGNYTKFNLYSFSMHSCHVLFGVSDFVLSWEKALVLWSNCPCKQDPRTQAKCCGLLTAVFSIPSGDKASPGNQAS